MQLFHISIRGFVFAAALLSGTTAVVATRFAVNTLSNAIRPNEVKVSGLEVDPKEERVPEFADLRATETQIPPHEDFDPSGVYDLDRENRAGYTDIEWIEISAREYSDESGVFTSRQIVPTGTLHAKKEFAFSRITIGNRELTFQTETIDGVRYEFTGTFALSNESITCEGCEIPPDLRGQLKKFKNGKLVTEMDAKFYVSGC